MQGRSAHFRLRPVNSSIELIRLSHLNPLMGRDDDDRRRMDNADPLPERTVCLDLSRATAGRVDHEGHLLTVRLKPLASKLL